MLSSLFGRIEEESTEEWDPHAVTQYNQVGLCELEGCWVLIHHLPHAVQEEHEQRGLDRAGGGGTHTKETDNERHKWLGESVRAWTGRLNVR